MTVNPDSPLTPEETAETERYLRAAHAMQTGVAMLLEAGALDEGSAKHTRTGINSALSDSGSLARLLVEKGIITRLEYLKAQADGMEREVESYRNRVEKLFPGIKVTLW